MPALGVLVKQIEDESKIKIPFGKENIFCFDNESFRFLMALKKGIQFSEREKRDFSNSWEKSVENTNAFLAYVANLTVHDIQETVKLNEVRHILMELARPIAEISQNIQINIKLANDKKNELNAGDFTMGDLHKKVMITQIDLVPRKLGHPRTVCTAPECTRVVQIGVTSKVDYITHCHPHCYLDGVKQDTINNVELKNCACMSNGVCKNCHHDWSKHMHISYENEQVQVDVVDENVQLLIDQKASNKVLIEAAIDSANQLIIQLEAEQTELINFSARFAHFTRQNAIAVFNDDLDSYLDLLIREEEAKKQAGAKNDQVLNGLRDVKQNYMAQKQVFDNACKSIGTQTNLPNDLEDINDMINDLYKFPMSGDKLKNIVDNFKKVSISNH